jgi:hypothetical protein
MNPPDPFWAPIGILIESMLDQYNNPIGVLGWIALLSTAVGTYFCVARRNYRPLVVLGGLVPAYGALVYMFSVRTVDEMRETYLIASWLAGILTLAVVAFGFYWSRGNRTAAALMLPANGLFLFGAVILASVIGSRLR